MKKFLLVVIALVAVMVSCNKNPSLAGSEFSNPNLVADGQQLYGVLEENSFASTLNKTK